MGGQPSSSLIPPTLVCILLTACGTTDLSGQPDASSPECGNGSIETGEHCDDENDADWDGCNRCEVAEFLISSVADGQQRRPSAALSRMGSMGVAWYSLLHDPPGSGVYGRILGADGVFRGPDMELDYNENGSALPHIGLSDDGGFVVAWLHYSDGVGIFQYSGCYNPDGALRGELNIISCEPISMNPQKGPSIGIEPDGGVVIAFDAESRGACADEGIYTQYLDAECVPDGAARLLSAGHWYPMYPEIAISADSSSVVVWQAEELESGEETGIYGRCIGPDRAPIGEQFHVNSYTENIQERPDVAMDEAGNFVVVWESRFQDGDQFGIFAQRYGGECILVDSEFQVNTTTARTQIETAVGMDAEGNFIVVWVSWDQDGDSGGIFGQRFTRGGTHMGSEFQINTYWQGDQRHPEVDMAPDGRFAVVWETEGILGSDTAIVAQRFDASGNPLGTLPW